MEKLWFRSLSERVDISVMPIGILLLRLLHFSGAFLQFRTTAAHGPQYVVITWVNGQQIGAHWSDLIGKVFFRTKAPLNSFPHFPTYSHLFIHIQSIEGRFKKVYEV